MRGHTLRDGITRWWAGELGAAGAALDAVTLPASLAFGVAVRLRNAAYEHGVLRSHAVSVPVLSVGNLSVGGAGKTPVAAWLMQLLRQRARTPALLHGGYAADEPALHRRWAPEAIVIAERDRVRGARRAIAAGADAIVLDDAFQHRRLQRDLDLVLVSAESWRGDRSLLPRRGWREPASSLQRADAIAVTRRSASPADAAAVLVELGRLAPGAVPLQLWLSPSGWWRPAGGGGAPGAAVAVCAIAQPRAFLENTAANGAEVVEQVVRPDHHEYGPADAAEIQERARGRAIVTTAKDWVKLERLLPADRVWVLEQTVVVEAGAVEFERLIDRVLA